MDAEVKSLELFKRLTKDGCKWHGDVLSRKWSECLYLEEEHNRRAVKITLEGYHEGEDYKIEGDLDEEVFQGAAIWIK